MEPKTKLRYDSVLALFVAWLALANQSFEILVIQPTELDTLAVDYLQVMYDEGRPKGEAGVLISALQNRFPSLKTHLLASWRAAKAWSYLEPGHFRKPWPEDLVWAVAGLAFELGWWGVGMGVILGLYGLLRPGEISNLKREDIRTPFDLVATSLELRAFDHRHS